MGEEQATTATALNNLGVFFWRSGDPKASRECLEQSLAIRKKVLGEKHLHTALSLFNLGETMEKLRRQTRSRENAISSR